MLEAVVTARVHDPLASIDLSKVKICDHFTFTSCKGLTDNPALWIDNGSEAATGNRPDSATRILHDLGLLIGIEPRRRIDDKAGSFEGVLADVDFRLLREQRAGERSGIHRRVDLLAIGDQRVPRERQIVFPAGELSNASNRAVDDAQACPVTLTPDHPLMKGWRDLAASLDQCPVRIEQKLRIVDRAAVPLVDADRD